MGGGHPASAGRRSRPRRPWQRSRPPAAGKAESRRIVRRDRTRSATPPCTACPGAKTSSIVTRRPPGSSEALTKPNQNRTLSIIEVVQRPHRDRDIEATSRRGRARSDWAQKKDSARFAPVAPGGLDVVGASRPHADVAHVGGARAGCARAAPPSRTRAPARAARVRRRSGGRVVRADEHLKQLVGARPGEHARQSPSAPPRRRLPTLPSRLPWRGGHRLLHRRIDSSRPELAGVDDPAERLTSAAADSRGGAPHPPPRRRHDACLLPSGRTFGDPPGIDLALGSHWPTLPTDEHVPDSGLGMHRADGRPAGRAARPVQRGAG